MVGIIGENPERSGVASRLRLAAMHASPTGNALKQSFLFANPYFVAVPFETQPE
jgi:hypothetical protein